MPVTFFEKRPLPVSTNLSSNTLTTQTKRQTQHEEVKVQRHDGTTKFHISGLSLIDIDEEEEDQSEEENHKVYGGPNK